MTTTLPDRYNCHYTNEFPNNARLQYCNLLLTSENKNEIINFDNIINKSIQMIYELKWIYYTKSLKGL